MQDRDWQAEISLLQRRETKARQILGVSDSSGAEKIKQTWRKQSLRNHPDNNGGSLESPRRFIRVNCAYRFLTEGKGCEELDDKQLTDKELTGGKYRLDNPWGYFVWWREKYFGLEK
ncbi:MAG: J domain-containing protein [Planctomycetota bacterium]|nr:J domain-containing protein [Planctomycetota bacterium]